MQPLHGVRVIFLGTGLAGPFAARYLAVLGAEVIKLSAGSRMRAEGSAALPWAPKRGMIPDFPSVGDLTAEYLNIGLELKHPDGMDVLRRLIKVSDVVMFAYGASVPGKLGLTYDALREIKEDIIMVEMPAFGTTGPYCNFDLFGTNISPMTGLDGMVGYPDLPEPEGTGMGGTTFTDFFGGYSGALAILSALHYKARTGKGQHIDQALMDVTVATMAPAVLDFVANGVVAGPKGNRVSHNAPHGTYRCRGEDRWCAIAVTNEDEWQGLCRVLGNPVLASDPRFATLKGRLDNHDELDRIIEEFTSTRDPYEVMYEMQHEGVPAGVTQNHDDLLMRDIHLQARGLWVKLPVEKRGQCFTYGVPMKMSATPTKLTRGQAVISQDKDHILKTVLGMTDEQVAKLVEEGAVNAPIPGDPTLANQGLNARWTGRLGSSLPRADELKWGS